MRYLNKRNEFLNSYIIDNSDKLIKEGSRSGPFENDIPWGDSLVGRLVMSFVRKAGIAANIVRIKPLTKRLRDEFDNILIEGKVGNAVTENQADITKLKTFALLKELADAVDNGEEVDTIISIIDSTIKLVEDSEIEDGKKKVLIKKLQDFKDFILSLGSDSVSTDSKSLYPIMVKNLKALSLIISNYKKVELNVITATDKETIEVGREYLHKGKVVKVVSLASNFVNVIPRDPSTKTYIKTKEIPAKRKDLKLYVESNIFRYGDFVSNISEARINPSGNVPGINIDRHNITDREDHLEEAFTKLKKDIELLISPKEKGIGVDSNYINEIISQSTNTEGKEVIISLFKEINRFLTGDKKSMIQDKDVLFKENIKTLLPKSPNNPEGGKIEIVAEKIARFIKRAIQFDGKNLYGGLGDLKTPLKDFVDTTKQIKSTDSQASAPNESISQKIKDYFDKNLDFNDFVVSKTEIEKVERNIQNAMSDDVTIGIDSIMEIVKLFNRAYKLHTTNVIPGGRSGGAVSRSVYNEYTPLGSGSHSGTSGTSDGPYRNNKIFNVWENAVLDIMKERKYQPIFSKNTEVRVGNELVKEGGAVLRRLITGLLDGDKLYNEGAQKKFLNDYFGPDAVSDKDKLGFGSDTKENAANAAMVDSKELSFVKGSELSKNEDLTNKKWGKKFLQIKGKEGSDDRTFYMFIEGIDGDKVYISYCTSLYYFKKYIIGQGGSPTISGSVVDTETNQSGSKYLLRYTIMKKDDFTKLLNGSTIELNSVTIGEEVQDKRVISPSQVSWLVDESKKPYTIINENALGSTKSSVGASRDVSSLLSRKYGPNKDFSPISKTV